MLDQDFATKLAELQEANRLAGSRAFDQDMLGFELKQAQLLHGRAEKEGVTEKDVDPEQLAMGVKVEMEHTDDPAVARRVACDHLAELPDYYIRLKAMEAEGKKAHGSS